MQLMQKSEAVAAMGPSTLLLPAWIKAALAANDRLKLYLTVVQAAAAHADNPESEPLDLRREMAAAGDGPAQTAQSSGRYPLERTDWWRVAQPCR